MLMIVAEFYIGSGISPGAVPGISTIATYPGSLIALIPDPTGTLIRINYGMVLDQGSVRWTLGEFEILPSS